MRLGNRGVQVVVAAATLAIVLTVAINFRELRLAYALYRYEGGQAAFTSKPLSVHFVGAAINTPLPATLFVIADSGDVRAVAAVHRNGCFVLSAAKPQATLSPICCWRHACAHEGLGRLLLRAPPGISCGIWEAEQPHAHTYLRVELY